jgi:hypothetical protein
MEINRWFSPQRMQYLGDQDDSEALMLLGGLHTIADEESNAAPACFVFASWGHFNDLQEIVREFLKIVIDKAFFPLNSDSIRIRVVFFVVRLCVTSKQRGQLDAAVELFSVLKLLKMALSPTSGYTRNFELALYGSRTEKTEYV